MQTPREYATVWCLGSKYPGEWFKLTYSKNRDFFEPVTNKSARPVIGQITHWQYNEPPLTDFD